MRLPAALSLLLSFGLLGLASGAPAKQTTTIKATVKNGTYSGLSLPTFDQEAFFGVPFAQPPIGDLRFRKPVALNASWTGIKPLTERCAGVQTDGLPVSEDCLHMNIIRPAGVSAGDDLPVALWIHGGAFEGGGINDATYNASYFVNESVAMGKPVVYVAIAYRLSLYGFLNSPELTADRLLNLGLHDQRLALEWVSQNIRAFGGDPSRVTIWGESAGAMSVSYHLTYHGGAPTDLFRAAIMQSGSPTSSNTSDLAATQGYFDTLLADVSCADAASPLACLREVPADVLNGTTGIFMWFPAIDGEFLVGSPTAQLAAGKFLHLPSIIGGCTDEGTAFGTNGLNTEADLELAIHQRYPKVTNATVAKLLELYPDDNTLGCPYGTGDGYLPSGRQDKRSNAIFGDVIMVGPERIMKEAMVRKEADVWAYRFDQPPTYGYPGLGTVDVGVIHSSDNSYIFGHPENSRTGDAELMRFMMRAWIAFVNDLDPNRHGLEGEPEWPKYDTQNATNVLLRRHGRSLEPDTFRGEGIAFINSIGSEMNK